MNPFDSITGRVFFFLFIGTSVTFALSIFVIMRRITHPYVVTLYLFSFLLLAYAVARIALKPLRELGRAAANLGDNIDSAPLPESGPTEVREAAIAFNAMQARIRRDVRERTSMLAAITHDLQTPVTRLRLRLEKVDDQELREKLIADLAVMSETIRDGLDLAQSLESREPDVRIDLDSVLASVCDDASDAGHDVRIEGRTHTFIEGSPWALRRCITNLVDNAIKYGSRAAISAEANGGRVIVRVLDDGPGMPEDQLDAVLDPFVRLEASRSRETGGTGIGLTIARNIAQRFGGTLTLKNRVEGGLEASLVLKAIPE